MQVEKSWGMAIASLLIKAETNDGVSREEINSALQEMKKISNKYKGKKELPMSIVNVLIDMQSSLMTSGDRHLNQLCNEEMAGSIYHAAFELSAIARDMTV